MSEKIQFTVDSRPAAAAPGARLLDVLQEMGVQVPTLCHHRSLEPSGACRLCVVEITHPDWRGWSGLVTSCLYPVEPGLEVLTRTERVRQTRATLLELYLARCPDSSEIRDLARSEGVDTTGFPARPDPDLCIQCGLCTRVCNDLGPAAIAPLGRGTEKTVGPRPDKVAPDCTGCLACAHICPTGEIRTRHHDRQLTIWNRDFAIPLCSVERELCRGCGICEEVCPVAIPRVVVARDGTFTATISPETCLGCGICAGACPTGAISQPAFPDPVLFGEGLAPAGGDLRGQTVVVACSRSFAGNRTAGVITVPCIGRVSVSHLLGCLARGADGVLVMCRDRATCPYEKGGQLGELCAAVADELAGSAGLGRGRIRFCRPLAGPEGPAAAAADFRASLTPTPLTGSNPGVTELPAGLDGALAQWQWFAGRPELAAGLPESCADLFDPVSGGRDLLFLGNLPVLDLLLGSLVPGWRLRDLLADAVDLLRAKGLQVTPVLTAGQVAAAPGARLFAFCEHDLPPLAAGTEIITLGELAGLPPPARQGKDAAGESFRFGLGPEERQLLIARLKSAPELLNASCPHELARLKLLLRPGAWQEAGFPEPAWPVCALAGADTPEASR